MTVRISLIAWGQRICWQFRHVFFYFFYFPSRAFEEKWLPKYYKIDSAVLQLVLKSSQSKNDSSWQLGSTVMKLTLMLLFPLFPPYLHQQLHCTPWWSPHRLFTSISQGCFWTNPPEQIGSPVRFSGNSPFLLTYPSPLPHSRHYGSQPLSFQCAKIKATRTIRLIIDQCPSCPVSPKG